MQHTERKPAIRLLDLRFNYVPSAATDIAATWRRFGFDANANQQRRELFRKSFASPRVELMETVAR